MFQMPSMRRLRVVFSERRGGASLFAFRSNSFSPPIATTSSLIPVTSANAAINAEHGERACARLGEDHDPEDDREQARQAINAESPRSSGSRNDAPTNRIPSATA